MLAWSVGHDDAVPGRPLSVDPASYLCILEEYKAHVSLGHPAQGGLQAVIASVLDIILSETDQHPFFVLPY